MSFENEAPLIYFSQTLKNNDKFVLNIRIDTCKHKFTNKPKIYAKVKFLSTIYVSIERTFKLDYKNDFALSN